MNAERAVNIALSLFDDVGTDILTDARWWEMSMLPALGLNDENRNEMPAELLPWMGHGLLIWQYPNQFGPYIARIARMARDIDSYIEIGCRHGGTFIVHCEVLRRLNPDFRIGVAVDRNPMPPLIAAYLAKHDDVKYIEMDTTNPQFRDWVQFDSWGLAFIDGDHSYAGVKHDWETIGDHARNVVFHDIASDVCPGVGQLWNEITQERIGIEFVSQYGSVIGNYMGIGMVC